MCPNSPTRLHEEPENQQKLVEDPAWEVMAVPEALRLEDFLAALRLWQWQRRMQGKPVGSQGLRPAS